MTTLTVSTTTNFSATVQSNVTVVDFTSAILRATATFAASQFNGIQIVDALAIDGSIGPNSLVTNGGSLNASGWTFTNWSATDFLSFNGSTFADTIFGSRQADQINGGLGNDSITGGLGADLLVGGDGNDQFIYAAASAVGAETISGGNNSDTVVLSGIGVSDLTGFTITGVEQLAFLSPAPGSVKLFGSQIGAGVDHFNTVTGDGTANGLDIRGNGIDLSGVVFANWNPAFDTITLLPTAAGIVTGSNQNDEFIDAGQGALNMSGSNGDDIFHYRSITGSATGDTINGGGGPKDTIVIDGLVASADFSLAAAITGVERLSFNSNQSGPVTFTEVQIASGITTIDSTTGSQLRILVTTFGGDFDASALTFVNWTTPADVLTILGNVGDNTLTGMANGDSISGFDGRDRIAGGAGADSLDGGLGTDMLVYSGSLGVTVNLGSNSANGGTATGDVITGFEGVTGGSGNDFLQGSLFANRILGGIGLDVLTGSDGDDTLDGGKGNDTIQGGFNRDSLTGGDGIDLFVFIAVNDSAFGGPRDVLTDFVQGQDKIDLFAIDAVTGGVDDAFIFRGTGGFGASAGLRVTQTATQTIVLCDVNGDQVADFSIVLTGLITLAASDFVL